MNAIDTAVLHLAETFLQHLTPERVTRHIQYLTGEEVGVTLPLDKVLKVTIEFAPIVETELRLQVETPVKTLDCLNCKKIFPINEMYSVDACSKNCQDALDMQTGLRA